MTGDKLNLATARKRLGSCEGQVRDWLSFVSLITRSALDTGGRMGRVKGMTAYPMLSESPIKTAMDRLDAWWTAQDSIVWHPDANRVLGGHCWGAYKPEPTIERVPCDDEEED